MAKAPLLTVLSFSGGKQSSALLWMILLGKIEKPDNFIVLNANPGMENSFTYKYVEMMFDKCRKAGIEAFTVVGPNLYEDLITLKQTTKRRIDNPPYWIKKPGVTKEGRLRQSCTLHYKIKPMDRAVRVILEDRFGISRQSKRLGDNIVEKWIGFTYDEIVRVKPSPKKYWYFRYPLIEMKMNKQDTINFFNENDLPIPPRSVCNACFANGLNTFREMYLYRPEDWNQAVNVDRSIRDLSQIGVRHEVYVSKTLLPLDELKELDFFVATGTSSVNYENEYSCDSGYCFV